MYDHLVFYDGECGLCDRVVQHLLKADTQRKFAFAPLQGKTAEKFLANVPEEFRHIDSMILVENFKTDAPEIYFRSKAVFRTCWLLGGAYRLIGWKYILPAWVCDWAYDIVARNRHRWFAPVACIVPNPSDKDRFLP